MSSEAIKVLYIILFMLVGCGSFLSGYLSRYLFSDDYDAGYCQGYEDGRKIQKQLHELGKKKY